MFCNDDEFPVHVHFESGALIGVANREEMKRMGIGRRSTECASVFIVDSEGRKRSLNLGVEDARILAQALIDAASAESH